MLIFTLFFIGSYENQGEKYVNFLGSYENHFLTRKFLSFQFTYEPKKLT